MAAALLRIDDIDNFKGVRSFPAEAVSPAVLAVVRKLDEREELGPFIQSILCDSNNTPHGPVEIADIITHKVTHDGTTGTAAFILKGKSFPTVRARHVGHQIFKLERIKGLDYAVFAATGEVLDEVKEQFFATAERCGWKYAIFDAIDIARALLAHGFLCPRDAQRIAAGRCPQCGYSPSKRVLNIFQEESLRRLDDSHKLNQGSGLIVLPPGSGKTRIAAEDAKRFGAAHLLYVAHTHEILDVAESEFSAVFGNTNVERLKGNRILPRSRVSLATIQYLANHLGDITRNLYDYLIVDEFHHAAAPTYRDLVATIQPKFLLGLTATPFRGDGQDVGSLCDGNVLVNFELRSGIETGILCPYHYFGCFDDIDYSNLRLNGTRYDVQDLERALVIPQRDKAIITKWQERAEGRPTIAFCCSHLHAERVALSFREKGIPAVAYLSTTAWGKRQESIQQLLRGEVKVLCVVDVMNEGADVPFVDCLLFLRPTESPRVYYQQLGRGLRKYVGKSHCVVIDFIGTSKTPTRSLNTKGSAHIRRMMPTRSTFIRPRRS